MPYLLPEEEEGNHKKNQTNRRTTRNSVKKKLKFILKQAFVLKGKGMGAVQFLEQKSSFMKKLFLCGDFSPSAS